MFSFGKGCCFIQIRKGLGATGDGNGVTRSQRSAESGAVKVVVEMGKTAIFFLGEEVVLIPLDLRDEFASGGEKIERGRAACGFYF